MAATAPERIIRVEQSVEAASGNGLSFNPDIAALPPYNAGMDVALERMAGS